MGGGCAFFDYNGDGNQDLLFVNSSRWRWDARPPLDPAPTMALYQNDGRGRLYWEHAQHGANDWSAHLRLGLASDASFLEEWQRPQFWDGPPHDLFFNLDRATGSELIGIQVVYDLNDFATTADTLQESSSVQRLPEGVFAYFGQRAGPVTFNSRNRVGALKLNTYDINPAGDLGLVDRPGTPNVDESFTGIPAWGYTGAPDDLVARGDFRQEVSMPASTRRYPSASSAGESSASQRPRVPGR